MNILIIILTIIFVIASSIAVFDTGINRAKRRGDLPADEPIPPAWVAGVYWIQIGLGLAILYMDWRYALKFFAICFLLGTFLPVLEIVGNILMSPFKSE